MGLLDGVLGQVLGGAMQGGGAGGGLGGLLGGGGGQADLVRAVIGMLGNDAQGGGLAALVQQFQQAGLGEQMGSWIGTGQNLPVSAEQLQSMMGAGGPLAGLAQQFGGAGGGAAGGDFAGLLAQVLPQVIDQLTPQGQVPQGGLGNAADLLGSLLGGQR